MNAKEIKNYLAAASASGIRPGLDRMRELCRRLDNPQDEITVIHVAGTNGKGSTSAYLASILSRVYKKVGWYSSPAVFDDRETIRILTPDGSRYLTDEIYESLMTFVIQAAEAMVADGYERPTVYELESAGAFLSFKNEQVDVAIIEVGMGGREDATNVIPRSALSVIAPIGLDHMQFLGGSLYQIAGEKAGIIKKGCPVVAYQPGVRLEMGGGTKEEKRQERLRERIIGRLNSEAEEKETSIRYVNEDALRIDRQELAGTAFTYLGEAYYTKMCGSFQPGNAALAIEAAMALNRDEITAEIIREGIACADWPGRFDIVSEDPLTIFDGAHNTDGVTVLSESIRTLLPGRRIYAVMGVFMDKAVEEMVRQILPLITEVVAVTAPGPRGLDASDLSEVIRRVNPWITVYEGGDDIAGALEKMQKKAAKRGATVLVFGSLSLARAVYPKGIAAERESGIVRGNTSTGNTSPGKTSLVHIEGDSEKNLLTLLQESGIVVPASCGGNGQCGKCRVRITGDDSKAEYRLACQVVPNGAVDVEIHGDDYEGMQSVGETVLSEGGAGGRAQEISGKPYGVAVDIGTTTLAVALVRRADGTSVDTRTRVNPQISFGADVISRIHAAEEGKADAMRVTICEALLEEIETILVRNGIGYGDVETVVVVGNTTMLHLVQGYDVSGLGRVPFTPVTLSLEKKTMGEVFDVVPDWPLEEITAAVPVIILPGASTYVGADIVSGMFALDFDKNDKIVALIDLGTNGELVIGDRNRRLVTSTAAGPALEGGNIRYGTASIKGAVSGVRLEKDESGLWQAEVERIGEYTKSGSYDRSAGRSSDMTGGRELKVAPGICGTGVIDMVAELRRVGLADENGLLVDDYFEDGFPFAMRSDGTILAFAQEDVREVQLAKAAIRAGFEILCERFGITTDAIDKVYIAGGFGTFLHIDRAVAIGLLPETLADKTEPVGNTALTGAIRFLMEPEGEERLTALATGCETISLAEDDAFEKRYVEAMTL